MWSVPFLCQAQGLRGKQDATTSHAASQGYFEPPPRGALFSGVVQAGRESTIFPGGYYPPRV
jgi:hypothetical protein